MNFEPLWIKRNRLENVAMVRVNLAKDDFDLKSSWTIKRIWYC